jgi:hypothetical protein
LPGLLLLLRLMLKLLTMLLPMLLIKLILEGGQVLARASRNNHFQRESICLNLVGIETCRLRIELKLTRMHDKFIKRNSNGAWPER